MRAAHRGEVRGDAKVLLRAALGDPEAGHDLVKAQKSAIVCAQLPETLHVNIKLRSCCVPEDTPRLESSQPWSPRPLGGAIMHGYRLAHAFSHTAAALRHT